MVKTYLIILLILLNIGIPGCRCNKDDVPEYECTPHITVPFPQDALDRFYFKTGTWWVYEEINNPGMEDSVWVFDHSKNTSQPDEKQYSRIKTQKCYDIHNTRISSVRYSEIRFFLHMERPIEGFDYEKEFFQIIEQPKGANDVYRLLLQGNNYRNKSHYGDNISLIDSVETKELTYYDVLHFEKTQSIFDYLQEAWYVKNIGMVKFKRTDGSEWELVRYTIVQ